MAKSFLRYFAERPARFIMGWRQNLNDAKLSFHSHEHFEIVYHLRGGGTAELLDGTRIPFGTRSVAIYPPRVTHNQVPTLPAEDCCIHLSLEGGPPEELCRSQHLGPFHDESLEQEIVRLTELPGRLDPAQRLAVDYRVTAVLIRLLAQVAGAHQPVPVSDNHAHRAKRYIDVHFATVRDMDELAAKLEVSTSHLRHVFRKTFGQGLVDYLTEIRIERAKSLLLHTALPQKAIADLCGFATDRYLSTRFRQLVGCTPGAFRHLHSASPASSSPRSDT